MKKEMIQLHFYFEVLKGITIPLLLMYFSSKYIESLSLLYLNRVVNAPRL